MRVRLWSLHPRHLDRQGLTALWREGLLAQAVLAGRTRGYLRHPQLDRFRALDDPRGALATYLDAVRAEASSRGYSFDAARLDDVPRRPGTMPVTAGQIALEWRVLLTKLAVRSPAQAEAQRLLRPSPHPSFTVVDGGVEPWERAGAAWPDR